MDIVDKFLGVNKYILSVDEVQKLKEYLKPLLIFPNTPIESTTVCKLFFTKASEEAKNSRKTGSLACTYFCECSSYRSYMW